MGSSGILAAINRQVGAANRDLILRQIIVTWFNEGTANNNHLYVQRTTALPGANTFDSIANLGEKKSDGPSATARVLVKPTGITLGAEPIRYIGPKTNTALQFKEIRVPLDEAEKPFVLTSGESLALVQESAGTVGEVFMVTFDWMEVTLG